MNSESDGPVFLAQLGDELARVAQGEAARRGAAPRSWRTPRTALAAVAGAVLVAGALATVLASIPPDAPRVVQRQAARPLRRAPATAPVVSGSAVRSLLQQSSRVSCYGALRVQLRQHRFPPYLIFRTYNVGALVLTNVTPHACDVAGYPALRLRDKHGRRLSPRVVHDPGDDVAVTLQPGQRARSQLIFTSASIPSIAPDAAPCTTPARVRIRLPTIPGSFLLRWRLGPVCDRGTIRVQPLR
jgi:uncharacterized protein DUF4232